MLVAPSILSADFCSLGKDIDEITRGGADYLHIDVMDGLFVPNITIGIPVIKSIKKIVKIPLDVHLMIERPERYVADFVAAGADLVTVHLEATAHLHGTLAAIKNAGAKAGIAINPHTPIEQIRPLASYCDLICIMTVNPGFGGQKFIDLVAPKVAEAAKMRTECQGDFMIEVDGGVSDANIELLKNYGCDIVVAGSYVFGAADRAAAIGALKKY